MKWWNSWFVPDYLPLSLPCNKPRSTSPAAMSNACRPAVPKYLLLPVAPMALRNAYSNQRALARNACRHRKARANSRNNPYMRRRKWDGMTHALAEAGRSSSNATERDRRFD